MRAKTFRRLIHAAAAVWLAAGGPAVADVKTWNGTTGDWFDGARWTNGLPAAGDSVIIASGSVLLTNSTPPLAALTLLGGSLTCSNWPTRILADEVALNGSSRLYAAGPCTNGGMSNRVWIVCTNLAIAGSARIDADTRGYIGGPGSPADGHGPGGGLSKLGGGSYGGRGAGSSKGVYGNPAQPTDPGSGGATHDWGAGGHGGGAVRIEAADTVTVNGTVTANGGSGSTRSGGGSGGGIWISCRLLAGTNRNGRISADGGLCNYDDYGCGGGGGRIAIVYDPGAQAAAPLPAFPVTASAGMRITPGQPGTLYFPDNRLLAEGVIRHRGQWCVPGLDSLAFDSLVLSNGWLWFPANEFRLTVTNDLVMIGDGAVDAYGVRLYNSGRIDLTNGLLQVGGNLILTNGGYFAQARSATGVVDRWGVDVKGDFSLFPFGRFHLQSALTNQTPYSYGGFLSVTGQLWVGSNAWIYPYSHVTNGGSCLFRTGSLAIEGGGGFNASGAGFRSSLATYVDDAKGPGHGMYSSGGGSYGGKGGYKSYSPYGSHTNPAECGSAGAAQAALGGDGGGLIRIECAGAARVNGTLLANGDAGSINQGRRGGGGSGGGIFLSCSTFASTNGLLQANGGLGRDSSYVSGGGGGGRIAVIYDPAAQNALPLPDGVRFSAAGGRSVTVAYLNDDDMDGGPGTLYFPDSRFLVQPVLHSGVWLAENAPTSFAGLTFAMSNAWLRFTAPGFTLDATQSMSLASGSRLDLSGGVVRCGSLFMTNWSVLTLTRSPATPASLTVSGNMGLLDRSCVSIYASPTSGPDQAGAAIAVTNDIVIGTNSWILPYSHPTNGGSVRISCRNLTLETANCGFNANGKGFGGGPAGLAARGFGTGGGYYAPNRGGGGYGGEGGLTNTTWSGKPYGSLENPLQAGSGGGSSTAGSNDGGGAGGGLLWILVEETFQWNGKLTADGEAANAGTTGYSAGGSGGGIYVRCRKLTGRNAIASVRGGAGGGHTSGGGGGGGGGRIAIWRGLESLETPLTPVLDGGVGAGVPARFGLAGTLYWGQGPARWRGTLLLVK